MLPIYVYISLLFKHQNGDIILSCRGYEMNFNRALNKEQTTCINGIFVLFVFLSHFGQYETMPWNNLLLAIGQLMVAPFLCKRQIGPILKERSLCEIIEPQGGRIFMPGTSKVDWMHMFAEQESSELSISQYCKLHGISDKAFYNARSRYKKTDETPSLVAVEVSDDTGSSNTGCISFKLNGMSFEFDESAPDSDIQRIIKICLSL